MSKTLFLVDGENLVTRYQSSLEDGRKPTQDTIHQSDAYVWHPLITDYFYNDVLRVSFYTTYVGDEAAIDAICNDISNIKFPYTLTDGIQGSGTLNPHVFKKERRSAKTKSVDINLTIDALRHAYNKDVSRMVICSGDGDYIPLIKEIMRHGIIVRVAAFSSGCHPALKHIPDDFTNIDEYFFEPII